VPLLDRGRTQRVVEGIVDQWSDYRGRAIEPIVRAGIERLLPIDGVEAHTVAGCWTPDGNTEVDIVGIDGGNAHRRVSFVGLRRPRHPDHLGRCGSARRLVVTDVRIRRSRR
jgi:hypothetical protein